VLQKFFAPHNVEMAPDFGVLAREALDFGLGEVAAEAEV
jgi:hypothetical protein